MKPVYHHRQKEIQKDPAACALFGAIALKRGRGHVHADQAREGIEVVRKERGGDMGNGVLFSHPNLLPIREAAYFVEIFASNEKYFQKGAEEFEAVNGMKRGAAWEKFHHDACTHGIWQAPFTVEGGEEDKRIIKACIEVNSAFLPHELRIISTGKHHLLIKDLENLAELYARYTIEHITAKAVIAHVRYPTGAQPIPTRAHPHCFGTVGMVFNGDVKSYSANRRKAEAMIAEALYPVFKRDSDDADAELERFIPCIEQSWVGSDAEVIAAPFYLLLKNSVSIPSAIQTLVPPFDNTLALLERGSDRNRMRTLLNHYAGLQLDGPVSAILLITTDHDVQLVAFRDRTEFRPLRIMYDRELEIVYAGSEDRQLECASGKKVTDPHVESYSLEPEQFLHVSSEQGIISAGRVRRPSIVVPPLKENGATRIETNGEPHLFAGEISNEHRILTGLGGNCSSAYSIGGRYRFRSSLQANAFEASSAEEVIVDGNVDIMTPNAFQGGFFYARGSGDARCGQQLRHAQKDKPPPVVIFGERIGTYGFKMMAGGIGVVLGISEIGREEEMQPLVGSSFATGMMDGTAYVRSNVPRQYIGKPPSARLVMGRIKELVRQGKINLEEAAELFKKVLDVEQIQKTVEDDAARTELVQLFYPKSQKPFRIGYQKLNTEDRVILDPHFDRFCEVFALNGGIRNALDTSLYTVVRIES